MELITNRKAQQYIPLNGDYTGLSVRDCRYFTLNPLKDGWEEVTYYTNKRKDKYINYEGQYDSWVYVLSNPSIPGYLKIGYTNEDPNFRAKQLSRSTGVVTDFKVEWAFNCFNASSLEKQVHQCLEEYRVNNQREFFNIPLYKAIEVITKIGQNYINLK